MRWKKITIIGVGLLGGSLGLAIQRRRLANRVAGFVRRAASLAENRRFKVVDEATRDLRGAVAGAELVILCTPLAQMRPLVKQMLPSLKRGAIVTDVGSVKAGVVKELESLVTKAGAHFVGSHPMAGAEKTGMAAARADLFVNSACAVTPSKKSNRAAVCRVEAFWKSIGGRPVRLSAELHDALVGRSSHLPHVIAATLASGVLSPVHPGQQPLFCANGFRDTTRIASGSPEMWRDIALANRKNLARSINAFIADLKKIQRKLTKADGKAVMDFFEMAKWRRDEWRTQATSSSPE